MEEWSRGKSGMQWRELLGERNWAWGKGEGISSQGGKIGLQMSHGLSVTSSGCLLLQLEVDCYLNSFFFFFLSTISARCSFWSGTQ